jgi:glycosyltransferase involved in cell wall biosynthesis
VLRAIAPLTGRVACLQYDGTNAASISEAMTSIDYLAVPSRWIENIPLVALEALAHGTPILVPGHTSLCELVTDGRHGHVFQTDAYGRPTNLTALIMQLAANVEENRMLPRQPLYLFSPWEEARRVLEVYGSAAKANPAKNKKLTHLVGLSTNL